MKQGPLSRIGIKRSEPFHLRLAALIHSGAQLPALADSVRSVSAP